MRTSLVNRLSGPRRWLRAARRYKTAGKIPGLATAKHALAAAVLGVCLVPFVVEAAPHGATALRDAAAPQPFSLTGSAPRQALAPPSSTRPTVTRPTATRPTATRPTATRPTATGQIAQRGGVMGGEEPTPFDLTAPLGGAKKGSAKGPSIEVNELEAIDLASVGVLEGIDGFPTDMWKGMPRQLATTLLARLPLRVRSPAMRSLMRRLLLSNAAAPAGEGDSAAYMARRIEMLVAMGQFEAARALYSVTPGRIDTPALKRADLRRAFLSGALDEACQTAGKAAKLYPDHQDFQKARLFCLLRADQINEAMTTLAILQESGIEDALFLNLVQRLTGTKGATALSSFAKADALDFRMAEAAGLSFPGDLIDGRDPGFLAAVAASDKVALPMRLAAAEQAEAAGALAPEILHDLYRNDDFSTQELAKAFTLAAKDGGPRGRALLFQAAEQQDVPAARAAVLQKSWEIARNTHTFHAALRANLPFLLDLEPSPELVWFAEDAGRALFTAGEVSRGLLWLRLARREAGTEDWVQQAGQVLWSYALLSGIRSSDTLWGVSDLAAWMAMQQQRSSKAEGARRTAVLLTLMQALGESVKPTAWSLVLTQDLAPLSTPAHPALHTAMRNAASNKQLGGTVLFALLLLGNEGVAAAGPMVMADIITQLKAVGLTADAHALAVESALANGL